MKFPWTPTYFSELFQQMNCHKDTASFYKLKLPWCHEVTKCQMASNSVEISVIGREARLYFINS